MSHLTKVALDWPFNEPEHVQKIKALCDWLEQMKHEGYTIVRRTLLVADPSTQGGMMFRGTYTFVDGNLAMLFKLMWG